MAETIRIKKGLDIPLAGRLSNDVSDDVSDDTLSIDFALVPDDFPGIKWRAVVSTGDEVKVGSKIMEDKGGSPISLVSPVAGKITDVIRGERRKIEAVTLVRESDSRVDLTTDFSNEKQVRETLQRCGLWALMRQRPYDIIPAADALFRDVFVTAFDSAPLAPEIVTPDMYEDMEEGLRILAMLTEGKVYLGTAFGSGITSAHADVIEYQGPHPAGNVGVQIAQICPVNKGETVLTLDARTTARIGHLSLHGKLDTRCEVGITGPEAKHPKTIRTTIGAAIKDLVKDNIIGGKNERIISGNVLTGIRVDENSYLRFPYRQISIIAEGDTADEFMGWASMCPGKYSVKRTFPSFFLKARRLFNFDARVKGGHRAMILSGEYDKVFPFDIYPEYLLKAIIARDIDKMEQLGIYEVAPEDFALPEFVDTSKIPLQKIVREGLDYLRQETE